MKEVLYEYRMVRNQRASADHTRILRTTLHTGTHTARSPARCRHELIADIFRERGMAEKIWAAEARVAFDLDELEIQVTRSKQCQRP